MRKLSYILAVSFFMIGMIACDKIEEPYKKPSNESTDVIPLSAEDTLNWENKKVVLLEDYTGVRCNNCPVAGELALALYEQYHHQLVVLGVHAGFLSMPTGGFPDFRTEEGTEWYNFFGFDSNPIGTVNRQNNGTYGYNASAWSDAVASTVEGQPDIRLLSATQYNESTRELKVSVYSKFLSDFSDNYNLTVCLMEDGIIGKQLTPDGIDTAYNHRHVFRGCLNTAWGTELNNEPIAPNYQFNNNYSIFLKEDYNPDNCYIIAYIYKRDTKEILQVTEKKIK